MLESLRIFPEQASTFAAEVDTVYLFLVGMSTFFVVLIFGLVIYFAAKYRRRSINEVPPLVHMDLRLEIAWTVIPLILALICFAWGAQLFITMGQAPAGAMEIHAVGRQWMWKFQHPLGGREINQLHVPVGIPVKILLASEDAIHSFFVPAFRIKMDVVPGKYTSAWFEATKEGEFHLFCAEYCGTQHSGMIGRVVVMKPADYQDWVSRQTDQQPLAVSGERLFQQRGCATCHRTSDGPTGPALLGLFGRRVRLQSGDSVVADEGYIRESILNPNAKITEGYQAIMPTFQGQVSEEGLHQMIAYIKSLSGAAEGRKTP